jgi:hypothetical protein
MVFYFILFYFILFYFILFYFFYFILFILDKINWFKVAINAYHRVIGLISKKLIGKIRKQVAVAFLNSFTRYFTGGIERRHNILGQV